MNTEHDPHPSAEQLTAFDVGGLAPTERAAIEEHIAGCAACCQALEACPEDGLVALVRAYSTGTNPLPLDTPISGAPGSGPRTDATTWNIPPALVGHPRYRILGELGRGGMGVVYKAIQRHTDRVVALKVMAQQLQVQPSFVKRFRREVTAVARLCHPNIVLAYDADEAGELHFLVMEYVDGVGLDRMVRERGPLPVAEVCEYIRQAALGLQHAHERGLVHRDIKPGNLLLTRAGQVKIVDLGLARLARVEGEAITSPSASRLFGTVDYLAPEQAREPAAADVRADIYSLGCTLYHLLTGRPPFPEGATLQKLLAHQDQPPRPVSDLRPDVPAPLVVLVQRMLAKQPGQRPSSAAEVASDLARILGREEQSTPAGRRARPRSRRLPLLLLALVGLLTVGTVVALVAWQGGNQGADDGKPAGITERKPLGVALLGPEEAARLKRQSRDLALAWLEAHNRWGPTGDIVGNLAKRLDSLPSKADGFQVALGPRLLKSSKLTLLVGRWGGSFVFEPTPEQAQALRMKDNVLRFTGYRSGDDLRRVHPRMLLSSLEIARADTAKGKGRLVGKLAYQLLEPIPEALHVRSTYYPSSGRLRTMGMSYLKAPLKAERGEVAFDLPGLNTSARKDGFAIVFIELASQQHSRETIESNALATLITWP
jgi:predicted Ser/Thr protein kinase